MKNIMFLDENKLSKVSGGFLKQTESGISAVCDNCEHIGAIPVAVSQLQPSHLCIDCMGKLRDTLGDELMKSYLCSKEN